MSAEIVFYTNPMSSGRTARWMLEDVGAAGPVEAAAVDRAMRLDVPPQMRRGWYGSREAAIDALDLMHQQG